MANSRIDGQLGPPDVVKPEPAGRSLPLCWPCWADTISYMSSLICSFSGSILRSASSIYAGLTSYPI